MHHGCTSVNEDPVELFYVLLLQKVLMKRKYFPRKHSLGDSSVYLNSFSGATMTHAPTAKAFLLFSVLCGLCASAPADRPPSDFALWPQADDDAAPISNGKCSMNYCDTFKGICQNGGTCRARNCEGYCECPAAYTGHMCETTIAKDKTTEAPSPTPAPQTTAPMSTSPNATFVSTTPSANTNITRTIKTIMNKFLKQNTSLSVKSTDAKGEQKGNNQSGNDDTTTLSDDNSTGITTENNTGTRKSKTDNGNSDDIKERNIEDRRTSKENTRFTDSISTSEVSSIEMTVGTTPSFQTETTDSYSTQDSSSAFSSLSAQTATVPVTITEIASPQYGQETETMSTSARKSSTQPPPTVLQSHTDVPTVTTTVNINAITQKPIPKKARKLQAETFKTLLSIKVLHPTTEAPDNILMLDTSHASTVSFVSATEKPRVEPVNKINPKNELKTDQHYSESFSETDHKSSGSKSNAPVQLGDNKLSSDNMGDVSGSMTNPKPTIAGHFEPKPNTTAAKITTEIKHFSDKLKTDSTGTDTRVPVQVETIHGLDLKPLMKESTSEHIKSSEPPKVKVKKEQHVSKKTTTTSEATPTGKPKNTPFDTEGNKTSIPETELGGASQTTLGDRNDNAKTSGSSDIKVKGGRRPPVGTADNIKTSLPSETKAANELKSNLNNAGHNLKTPMSSETRFLGEPQTTPVKKAKSESPTSENKTSHLLQNDMPKRVPPASTMNPTTKPAVTPTLKPETVDSLKNASTRKMHMSSANNSGMSQTIRNGSEAISKGPIEKQSLNTSEIKRDGEKRIEETTPNLSRAAPVNVSIKGTTNAPDNNSGNSDNTKPDAISKSTDTTEQKQEEVKTKTVGIKTPVTVAESTPKPNVQTKRPLKLRRCRCDFDLQPATSMLGVRVTNDPSVIEVTDQYPDTKTTPKPDLVKDAKIELVMTVEKFIANTNSESARTSENKKTSNSKQDLGSDTNTKADESISPVSKEQKKPSIANGSNSSGSGKIHEKMPIYPQLGHLPILMSSKQFRSSVNSSDTRDGKRVPSSKTSSPQDHKGMKNNSMSIIAKEPNTKRASEQTTTEFRSAKVGSSSSDSRVKNVKSKVPSNASLGPTRNTTSGHEKKRSGFIEAVAGAAAVGKEITNERVHDIGEKTSRKISNNLIDNVLQEISTSKPIHRTDNMVKDKQSRAESIAQTVYPPISSPTPPR